MGFWLSPLSKNLKKYGRNKSTFRFGASDQWRQLFDEEKLYILNHCDWPSNTIRVREECGTSNGYFGNNSEAGAVTREVEATTAKPKEVATTPKEPRIIAEPDFVAGAPVVFYVNKKTENKPPRLSQG